MTELYIAIALWCGQTYIAPAEIPDNDRPTIEVQECRERLMKCAEHKPVKACFSKEVLK